VRTDSPRILGKGTEGRTYLLLGVGLLEQLGDPDLAVLVGQQAQPRDVLLVEEERRAVVAAAQLLVALLDLGRVGPPFGVLQLGRVQVRP
jgi:hypothetical protein